MYKTGTEGINTENVYMYAEVLNAFWVGVYNSITEMKMIKARIKIFLHIENTAFVRIVTFANAVIGFIF
jgi:hypothetical protein